MNKVFNFKPLVNVRTQKDEFSDNLIATSVKGTFRVPPKTAEKLGIKDYSAVSLFSAPDEDGKEIAFIAKGHDGTVKRDENGEIVTGSRNVTVFEETDPMIGAIVRETTAGSKILAFTSTATWKMLGGAEDKELVLSLESIGEVDYPLADGTLVNGEVFQLSIIKEREVNTRTKKSETTTEDKVEDAVAEELANADYEEEEV